MSRYITASSKKRPAHQVIIMIIIIIRHIVNPYMSPSAGSDGFKCRIEIAREIVVVSHLFLRMTKDE